MLERLLFALVVLATVATSIACVVMAWLLFSPQWLGERVVLSVAEVTMDKGDDKDHTFVAKLTDGRWVVYVHGGETGSVYVEDEMMGRTQMVHQLVGEGALPKNGVVVLVCCHCGVEPEEDVYYDETENHIHLVPVFAGHKQVVYGTWMKTLRETRTLQVDKKH